MDSVFFFLLVDFSTLDMNWYSGLTIGCSLIVGGKQWVPKLTRSFRPLYQLFLTSIQSSLHLCVHPSLCKSIHCLSVHPSTTSIVCIHPALFIHQFIRLSIHPSFHLFLSIHHLSIHSLYLPIHPSSLRPSVPPSPAALGLPPCQMPWFEYCMRCKSELS